MRARKHISAASRQTGDPPGTLPRALRCATPRLRRAALRLLFAFLVALPAAFLAGCGSTTGSSDRAPAQAPSAAEQGATATRKAAEPTQTPQSVKAAGIPVIAATVTQVIDGDLPQGKERGTGTPAITRGCKAVQAPGLIQRQWWRSIPLSV